MKPPSYVRWLLLAFLFCDTAYSAWQYYHQPLDGDMAWNALPAPDVAPTLADPLGVATWWGGRIYANPNRFFGQVGYRAYLLGMPRGLRSGFDAVASVYLAAALLKWVTHVGLLLLIMRLVTGSWRFWHGRPVVALALLAPFFQAGGYRSQMGLIDPSTTYTFFYALPALLLLIYLIPYADLLTGRSSGTPTRWTQLGLMVLTPVICLSGPLNPGIILVLTVVAVAMGAKPQLPPRLRVFWIGLLLMAAYSLFVGTYNSLTVDNPLPIVERYLRLPRGVLRILTEKVGPIIILAILGVNYVLLRRLQVACRWTRTYRWFLGFALLYTLLLPLGGYREYRPLIVRYDTWLPVTLGAIALYAAGAASLVQRGYGSGWYGALLVATGLVFTLADKPDASAMKCERDILHRIDRTQHTEVLKTPPCSVLDWQVISSDYERERKLALLRKWDIVRGR
jgi:hypothetical protein